jgi:hypothetical protein
VEPPQGWPVEPLSMGTLDLLGRACVLCAHPLMASGADSVRCRSGHQFKRVARYAYNGARMRAGGPARSRSIATLPQDERSSPLAGDPSSPVATVTAISEKRGKAPSTRKAMTAVVDSAGNPPWPMGSLCGTDYCADPCCCHAPPEPAAVLEELREREGELTEKERALRASRSWRMETLAEIREERAKRA